MEAFFLEEMADDEIVDVAAVAGDKDYGALFVELADAVEVFLMDIDAFEGARPDVVEEDTQEVDDAFVGVGGDVV